MTLDLADVRPGERVLDVGCGTGTLAVAAKRRVGAKGTVHGVDASRPMIERARQRAAAAGAEVEFETACAERLPFADAAFDVVLSSLVLHHLPDDLKPQALREIRRVLAPGGRLLAVDFEPPKGTLGRLLAAAFLGHTMAANDLRRCLPMMEAAGFSDLESGPTQHRLLAFARGRACEDRP